ncbi:MAG: hypothetical protein ACW9WZ_02875 [Nitrosopumilus sp.]|jgi:hypothetical protein
MGSKKGVIVTVSILAIISGASFLVWTIPENNESTFIVTDYGNYLEGVKNIHEVIQESTDMELNKLINGEISSQEYIQSVDITLSQATSQISEFVTSKPPEEWQSSYISYMDSLRKYNEYLVETKVLADLLENNADESKINEILNKIESLKQESLELAKFSNDARP